MFGRIKVRFNSVGINSMLRWVGLPCILTSLGMLDQFEDLEGFQAFEKLTAKGGMGVRRLAIMVLVVLHLL